MSDLRARMAERMGRGASSFRATFPSPLTEPGNGRISVSEPPLRFLELMLLTDSLLARVGDLPVGFKEGSDVERLASP